MSNFQQYVAEVQELSPDWDEVWEHSPIPYDKEQWRSVISQISQSPEIPERLVVHGWSVANFERALQDNLYLIQLRRDAVGPTAEAAFIVLSDAVGRIHESRKSLALELRQQAMIDLALPIVDAQEEVVEKGWTYDKIGALVGLTKQRARELARFKGSDRSYGFHKSRAAHRSERIVAQSAK